MNIGIVGCGDWASKIINEINQHNSFNLTSIVCRKKNFIQKNLKIFNSVEEMIRSDINDCIYVAAQPNLNLEIIKLVKNKNIPLVLEKPTTDTYQKAIEMKKIIENYNLIVYPNLVNYFSDTFKEFKEIIDQNYNKIKEIIIYEGNFGPFRNNIHPVWDWGFHSISLFYLLFGDEHISEIANKEIKSNNIFGKGIVTKFSFTINSNIKVKIITGNLFKKKLRKIKVLLQNKEFILNDTNYHRLYIGKKLICQNTKTPINSLLNTFQNEIRFKNYELSNKLIDVSCKTVKLLEKFYKC